MLLGQSLLLKNFYTPGFLSEALLSCQVILAQPQTFVILKTGTPEM